MTVRRRHRLVVVGLALIFLVGTALSFSPPSSSSLVQVLSSRDEKLGSSSKTTSSRNNVDRRLYAGGFNWEDPADIIINDPGVENPYKNPSLLETQPSNDDDGDGGGSTSLLKVDPARLLSPRLQGCNLYLIGMMGSGKSAVGDALARRMGTYNFLDTDTIVERVSGLTIPQIFETEGESAFRDVEAQVLDSVHAHVRCVISTGGGIILRNQNWSKLQTGIVIYLNVSPEIIYARIKHSTDRPLLSLQSTSSSGNPLDTLIELTNERKEKYEQADVTIDITADMNVQDTADKCIRVLHDFIDDNPPAWKKAKVKARADGLNWVN